MVHRLDYMAVQLTEPKHASPNDAAAVQELLGGKFGAMSTLMNYTRTSRSTFAAKPGCGRSTT